MPRTPQDVTEAELAILQVLWDRGTATVRELTEILYPDGGSSEHATVQKLLGRLETKQCVNRDRNTWPHTYQAAIGREDLIGRRLRATAEDLCDGSMTPLLTHLVESKQLNAKERESLRNLLDELDRTSKSGRGKKRRKT